MSHDRGIRCKLPGYLGLGVHVNDCASDPCRLVQDGTLPYDMVQPFVHQARVNFPGSMRL
jgi:hypothetical protein